MNTATRSKLWILILCVLVIAPFIFVYAGVYNVAASEDHYRPTKWILSAVKENSVAVRANAVTVPTAIHEQKSEAAAGSFDAMCAGCHGAPGKERSFIGKGLNPLPPDLGHAAEEMTAQELFWITKNGIKMTGMPAFGKTHTDEELWPIIAFLEDLPAMDAESYAGRVGSGEGHHHEHENGAAGAEPGGGDDNDHENHTHEPGTGV